MSASSAPTVAVAPVVTLAESVVLGLGSTDLRGAVRYAPATGALVLVAPSGAEHVLGENTLGDLTATAGCVLIEAFGRHALLPQSLVDAGMATVVSETRGGMWNAPIIELAPAMPPQPNL